MVTKLFEFEHPKHGYYAVYYDSGLRTYGITKSGLAPCCAYASIAVMFGQKGL